MKVLGISFGRVNKNCDIIVKHALMAAEKAGAEVKFINTMRMDIRHCTGCGACSATRGGQVRCVQKDDYLTLENAVLDADGIIVAAPVYSIAPTGQFVNFFGRFGAAHDQAAIEEEQKRRIAAGKTGDELLDPRLFKNQYVALVSVGGAHTPNWVSMGLPNMYMFGMSTAMKTVGQIDAYDMGQRTSPLFDEAFMDEVAGLGTHLAESIGKPFDEVTWYGEEGICPVCHNKLLSVTPGKGTEVECPLCGIYGKLAIDENGQIRVAFSDAEKKRARNTLAGLYEHFYELGDIGKNYIPKNMAMHPNFNEMLQPYKDYKPDYDA